MMLPPLALTNGAPFGIVFVFILLAVTIRLLAGGWDKNRIREYVESRGGRLLQCDWAPLGRGWFGEKSDRIYEIRYVDRDGHEHQAGCKTSLWTGVYFTEDTITRRAPGSEPALSPYQSYALLQEENERLRAEVERLRRQG